MSLSDEQRLELETLSNALADGAAGESERRRLQEMLRESPAAREHYVRFIALGAALIEAGGEQQADPPDLYRAPRRSKIIAWCGASLAAAAAVAFGIWTWLSPQPAGDNGVPVAKSDDSDGPETIALLAAASGCQWQGSAWQPGEGFLPGQKLELLAGLAEIAFDCGARVLLEGPASLELISAWEAELRRGSLRATAPAEAIGFKIGNPEVDVVDLGTDFSVVTDESGSSEVFVHEGAVEVQPRENTKGSSPRAILREREARRFARTGVSNVAEMQKKFARLAKRVALPPKSLLNHSQHWSFDEADAASPPLLPQRRAVTQYGQGPWGRTLLFDGTYAARAPVVNFTPEGSRAAAFWVRLPSEGSLPDSQPMLTWRGARGRPLEIGWNRDPARGVVGALQVRYGARAATGSSSLRDGKWRHIAVILDRRHGQQEFFGVKLYVDGRLEAKTARRMPRRADPPEPLPSGEVVWFGRPVHHDSDAASMPAAFKGELDEIYLIDGILTQADVRGLFMQNRLRL